MVEENTGSMSGKKYKKNVTDISKWLHHFLGLAFLNPKDVDKGNNKITELRTILQRESPNS